MPETSENLKAVVARLSAQGIHSILAQFADIHGVAKGKLVPLAHLPQWVEQGAGFAGPSIWGTGLGRLGARSEYFGRVVAQSLRPLPFMPGVAHAVCDGFAGGEPLATCSRQVLKRQLQRVAQRGWTLWVGIEPEFFVFKRDALGQLVAADAQDKLDKPSYDLKAIQRNQAFLASMRETLLALDFDLLQIDHEDAWGQYEINYRFDDALAAADRYMLFKLATHAVAQQHGLVFSAMPKPFAQAPGSGLHFHLSLTDAQGQPLMADATAPLGISTQGRQFAAGLLAHAPALAALCAPTVNSYKRLACGSSASGTTWAPVWSSWGDNNRTCLLRTVDSRLEWRLPDPACNVYLALAATLAAGLDGIDTGLQPPQPCVDDLYDRYAAGLPMPQRLPADLGQALAALAQDQGLQAAVGEEVCVQFWALKADEWQAYSLQVSPWEWERYAAIF
jgi:glutamine synthetase